MEAVLITIWFKINVNFYKKTSFCRWLLLSKWLLIYFNKFNKFSLNQSTMAGHEAPWYLERGTSLKNFQWQFRQCFMLVIGRILAFKVDSRLSLKEFSTGISFRHGRFKDFILSVPFPRLLLVKKNIVASFSWRKTYAWLPLFLVYFKYLHLLFARHVSFMKRVM